MFDKKAFIEEFIQLQLKHDVLVEGYDIDFWTKEEADEHVKRYPASATTAGFSEQIVRNTWEKM